MAASANIVILAWRDDSHVPFVTRHIAMPVVIVDHTEIPAGIAFSHRLRAKQFDTIIDGQHLRSVRSVWYRRTARVDTHSLPVPRHLRDYCADAMRDLQNVIYSRFPGALWISQPEAIFRANDKLLQLEVAARLGFRVPDTLLTSSPQAAKDFIQEHPGGVVTKFVQKSGIFIQTGQAYAVYTSKVDDRIDLSGLRLAPAMFQQAIDVALDIRVTVVGRKVFAAAIQSPHIDEPASRVRDWRIAIYKPGMHIEAFELPKKIADLCVAHVRELGLQFGALDLLLDKTGTFWFLENNPNGQWAFVEEQTGQHIGKAIAMLLIRGKQE